MSLAAWSRMFLGLPPAAMSWAALAKVVVM
jgi:hypothetical protein